MILVVHSHPKANHCFRRHLPYWKKQGFDRIIAVATEGGGCVFPPGVEQTTIGRDVYLDGDALPRRWADTVEWMVSQPNWDQAAIINADTILLKPFPKVGHGFHCILAGILDSNGEKKPFYHNPILCNRKTWELVLRCGRQMIAEGDIEGGYPDFFAGKLCSRFSIPVFTSTFHGYTRNTIETFTHIREAHEAVVAGAVAIHGVKSAHVLDRIVPLSIRP